METPEEKIIKFKYKFPESYNPQYVTGCYGGSTPAGELIMNFYLERFPVPNEMHYSINAQGGIGDVQSTLPPGIDKMFIRYVAAGLVMNLSSAKQFHKWLGTKIEIMEKKAASSLPHG